MNELVVINQKGQSVTTSLKVAEIFGKNHAHVLRDIQSLECSEDFRESNFGLSSYVSQQGKELPMYEIAKDGFSFLVMGYTGAKAAEFKEKFINEFNKRESLLKDDDYILSRALEISHNKMKALEQQLTQRDERLKLQDRVIKEAAPKVEYYEEVLQSESTFTITQIAKELGMGPQILNTKLHLLKIQYKQSGQWLLYHNHQGKGYTKTRTYPFTRSDGSTGSKIETVWTEKGREYIHSLLRIPTGLN